MPSNEQSVIANYFLVDRGMPLTGLQYKHAFMITNVENIPVAHDGKNYLVSIGRVGNKISGHVSIDGDEMHFFRANYHVSETLLCKKMLKTEKNISIDRIIIKVSILITGYTNGDNPLQYEKFVGKCEGNCQPNQCALTWSSCEG